MPVLRLRALERENPTTGFTRAMDYVLRIEGGLADGQAPGKLSGKLSQQRRRIFSAGEGSFRFSASATVSLRVEKADIGSEAIGSQPTHRARIEYKPEKGPKFILWYEVIPDGMTAEAFHDLPGKFTLRQMFGRLGAGTRGDAFARETGDELIYRCVETISVRDSIAVHRSQDGGGGNRVSLRDWIRRHCNSWGEASVIPIADLPSGPKKLHLLKKPNWTPVRDERSRVLAGIQWDSYRTNLDSPFTHRSLDWLFNIFPSPSFHYLLAYTAKTRRFGSEGASIAIPYSHNEWENEWLPTEWRPFSGEYVTVWGRHVIDRGHLPSSTEIHPGHAIALERTTVARLEPDGPLVPVNRMILGMGSSGGFPGVWWPETDAPLVREELGERWTREFGGMLKSKRSRSCWVTNLTKHDLRLRMFPPVPRPRGGALRAHVVLSKLVAIDSSLDPEVFKERLTDFLQLSLRLDREGLWQFRDAPASLQPQLSLRDGYAELEINLSRLSDFPVAYYAVIDCGWDRRGDHRLQGYEVTYDELTARKIHKEVGDKKTNEWTLFFGCNGSWRSWRSDEVHNGSRFAVGEKIAVWTVDDLPLVLRDNGIERDVALWSNEQLDRLELSFAGVDHLAAIRAHAAKDDRLDILAESADALSLRAAGNVGGKTAHEWALRIRRTNVID